MSAETVRGILERVTFRSEESGWCVWKIAVKDAPDLVTAVGESPSRTPGEELELVGEWTTHPKFGRQFRFTECRSVAPSTVEGIKRYLGSGLVKGVGPKTAERIVDEFGAAALDVIEQSPDLLLKIKGITPKLLDTIKQTWEAQKEVRSVMLFLQSNGISPNFAAKIYAAYGQDAIEIVKEDPYRLADDIFGIGFLTADKVALAMGCEITSDKRIEAGVAYAMGELTGEGHVYAPRSALAHKAADLLGVPEGMADAAIVRAAAAGRLDLERIRPDGEGETEAVYLPAYHTAEVLSAKLMARIAEDSPLSAAARAASGSAMHAGAEWVRGAMGIELAPDQLEALKTAERSKTMILTGGPGTGKTTIIRAIIGLCAENGMRVMLAAPTGRAAKRMSEATRHEAKTIHRMLEYSGEGGGFTRNAETPLECDLLIVDEASMIDIVLFYHLLRAVPEACRLILVGDIHQLPSVGPGNVLADLIRSGAIPTVELSKIFRQAERSSIIINAHRVNSGILPEEPETGGLKDFYMIEQEDPEKCVGLIMQMVGSRIKSAFGLDPLDDVQVLTPMHRGTLGAANLNAALQRALNPSDGPSITRGSRVFKLGDKVMQTKNDYERDVYNGDIGRISSVDAKAALITVNFDGREASYASEDMDALVHAYAVSIHKSQGSEYPAVIIPMHTQHYVLLKRNLLYTAITRGRELVILVGTRKALGIAVRSDDTKHRYTYLGERVRSLLRNDPLDGIV